MSLTVVITPFTVTVATAVLEEDQLKFPLPPVACHKHQRIRFIISTRTTPRWQRVIATNTVSYKECPMLYNTFAIWQIKSHSSTTFVHLCALKIYNYLYCVLISSDLGLPWKCKNTGTENYRIIDFYILFIVDWVGKCMDISGLKRSRGHRKWWGRGNGQKVNAIMTVQVNYSGSRIQLNSLHQQQHLE